MWERNLRSLGRGFVWMAAWALAGYLLLVLAYCLPVERMQKHLESSVETFQGGSRVLVKDASATWLDYLTDATILSETVYQGDQSPFEQAAAVYSNSPGGERDQTWPYRKVVAAMQKSDVFSQYARYWHGYLLYMKPLLLVLDYKNILLLNMLAQLVCMFGIAQLLARRSPGRGMLLPAAVAFGMLTPPAMALCLQYMPCFYVMAAACLVLLRWPGLAERHTGLFFLTVGMAASYFDFLTFPLITLGIPLILYLLGQNLPWRQGVRAVGLASVCWGAGYAGFWAMKWCIGSAVLGQNLFADAWNSFALRSSHETQGQAVSYGQALQKNVGVFAGLRVWGVLLALAAVALLLRLVWLWRRHMPTKDRLNAVVPLLLVACMPFAWYFVTVNHSYIHYGYTHKELAITGMALAAVVAVLFRKKPLAAGAAAQKTGQVA